MAIFYSDSGSLRDLQISGSTFISASTGIALQVKSSGSTIFSVSGSGGEIFSISDIGSSLFTVSSGSTTILNIDNTKKTNISGSLVVTGSAYISGLNTSSVSHVIMYNTSSGQLYYTASAAIGGGGSNIATGSFLTTASVSSNTITFTKADTSQFDITISTGSITPSFIATGSVTASVNTGSTSFQITNSSNTLLSIDNLGGTTISGSLTVVSGSTEFQVLNTGVKIGNSGSDAHTMTGSFGVQTSPVGGNLPGGIRVAASTNNVDYATAFIIGSYTLTGQRNNELYFSASTTLGAGPYLIGTQMYFGQTSPRLVFGGITGPFNASYMSIGANTGSEYQNGDTYPSGSNNFFLINTNLTTPSPSTNQRRSLYIGAQEIRFFITGSTNNDTFSSATPAMTISSGSNVFITGSSNVLTVQGSGSVNPIFQVQGSLGQLFSVSDTMSGSIFSVNDISGLSILDVRSDSSVRIGNYQAPASYTTVFTSSLAGSTVLHRVPTASYQAAYYDYVIRSGSNGRVGQIMTMWSGSVTTALEVSASQFGNTSGFIFNTSVSGENMILSSSVALGTWSVRLIVKTI